MASPSMLANINFVHPNETSLIVATSIKQPPSLDILRLA